MYDKTSTRASISDGADTRKFISHDENSHSSRSINIRKAMDIFVDIARIPLFRNMVWRRVLTPTSDRETREIKHETRYSKRTWDQCAGVILNDEGGGVVQNTFFRPQV